MSDHTLFLSILDYQKDIIDIFKGRFQSDNESLLATRLCLFDSMKTIYSKYGNAPISSWSKSMKINFVILNNQEAARIFGEVRDAKVELSSRSTLEIDYLCYKTYHELMEKMMGIIKKNPSSKISVTVKSV